MLITKPLNHRVIRCQNFNLFLYFEVPKHHFKLLLVNDAAHTRQ